MSQLEHNPQDYNPINYHTTPLGAISLAINANTRGTISEAYSGGGLLGLSPPPPSWTSEIYLFQVVFMPQRVLTTPFERNKI